VLARPCVRPEKEVTGAQIVAFKEPPDTMGILESRDMEDQWDSVVPVCQFHRKDVIRCSGGRMALCQKDCESSNSIKMLWKRKASQDPWVESTD